MNNVRPQLKLLNEEQIQQVYQYALRILDDAQVVLDEIAKAGPGSSFLSSPSTLKNYKKSYYVSDVYSRWPICLCRMITLSWWGGEVHLSRIWLEIKKEQK